MRTSMRDEGRGWRDEEEELGWIRGEAEEEAEMRKDNREEIHTIHYTC